MSIPSGDTNQWDVMAWALDQAQFLAPTQHHVLLYLCLSAFYKAENPEDAWVGKVLSKRSEQAEIQFHTGLSRRTIQRVLLELQEAGYIVYKSFNSPNKGSEITIAWREEMDELRAQVRRGVRDFPVLFKVQKKESPVADDRPLADVIDLSQRRHSGAYGASQ